MRDLTEAEAKELVLAALGPDARKLPKLSLDANLSAIKDAQGFFGFDVTCDNPHGSPVVGFFGVNRITGDVWELVLCRKVKTVELRRAQQILRRRIGLAQQERRKATGHAPCEP